jgi:glycosyltransferase involved in cell wall biosynthesis
MAQAVPTTLVSFGEKYFEETWGELNVRVLGPALYVRGQKTNPVTSSLIKEVRKTDIVHCHQQHVVASSLAAATSRMTGRTVFVSDLGGGGWDISGYISTDRWYHAHLHISEYSRSISGHSGRRWAHVISGGVDTNKFHPTNTPKTQTVLFVGRLLPHKGVNYLIEALPEGIELEIIGQPYDVSFVEHLRRQAVGKQVTFRFNCNDTELVSAYQRAMCVVLPSVYRTMYGDETRIPELLGQTLLEGMACGTATICTDVASMPEIVKHGVTGFVIPPNDCDALRNKLIWFRDHPAEALAMGEAARMDVLDRFTWRAVVQRCLSVYSLHRTSASSLSSNGAVR